ncbi:ABC transporter ATP-binding protein [Spirilliplanes yamanashiensis]|uniref:ABC transporter ATP-binding protein n=1 Tax=Spirilliplanes yamanashiensis TaxID=42233 RepID=UPI0019504019|nr:ABC transporter ATP-binding protein [Spirilliplanes yamanashiensis]MDP9819127.1 ABC-type hemin transport system ATPase subunit [Spirilliplanes yamanashiensis]
MIVAHQVDVLELVRDLNHQAARYADTIVAMASGRVVAGGPPDRVVTSDVLSDVFALDAIVVESPATGRPLVVPTEPSTVGARGLQPHP